MLNKLSSSRALNSIKPSCSWLKIPPNSHPNNFSFLQRRRRTSRGSNFDFDVKFRATQKSLNQAEFGSFLEGWEKMPHVSSFDLTFTWAAVEVSSIINYFRWHYRDRLPAIRNCFYPSRKLWKACQCTFSQCFRKRENNQSSPEFVGLFQRPFYENIFRELSGEKPRLTVRLFAFHLKGCSRPRDVWFQINWQ